MKPPHSPLPKPVANGTEVTPANPLFSVQTPDKLRANNLLNQTCGDQSRDENHYADKLGWMHKAILIANSAEKHNCREQAIALTIPNPERLSPIACAMGISRQLLCGRTTKRCRACSSHVNRPNTPEHNHADGEKRRKPTKRISLEDAAD
jgi:hypothetical protein